MHLGRSLAYCLMVAALLPGLVSPAYCNPINHLQVLPPFPPTLVAIFLETILVMVIVRLAVHSLHWVRFTLIWYVVNLFTAYVIMGQGLPAVGWKYHLLGITLLEITILLIEWTLLIRLVNAHWIRAEGQTIFTGKRAMAAVILGNIVSLFVVAPVHHYWPDSLMPEVYRPMIVE